jgi:membrane protease YdiL (CAAX protease family)
VRSCTSCGAASPLAATWCSQCFAPFGTSVVTTAAPVAVPAYDGPSGRMVSGRAFLLTIVAITVGALAMLASLRLSRSQLDEATYIRYAAVLTMAVYAVVGLLVGTQITTSVRLRWTVRSPAIGIAIGLVVGAALSGLILAAVSESAGYLNPDPRMVVMMSEGDLPHLAAAFLVACAAAPLVEEVLFRGVLLESLRAKGTAVALVVSAAGFAVWHLSFNLVPLLYYTLLGLLLGWLYVRRGLVCSMAAHFGFNGVLAVAAATIVLGGGGTATADGLTVSLPQGWTADIHVEPAYVGNEHSAMFLTGPSGASIAISSYDSPVAPSIDRFSEQIRNPRFATIHPEVEPSTLQVVDVPAGRVLEVDAVTGRDPSVYAELLHDGKSYELVFRSAGSPKALADFGPILRSLHVM